MSDNLIYFIAKIPIPNENKDGVDVLEFLFSGLEMDLSDVREYFQDSLNSFNENKERDVDEWERVAFNMCANIIATIDAAVFNKSEGSEVIYNAKVNVGDTAYLVAITLKEFQLNKLPIDSVKALSKRALRERFPEHVKKAVNNEFSEGIVNGFREGFADGFKAASDAMKPINDRDKK